MGGLSRYDIAQTILILGKHRALRQYWDLTTHFSADMIQIGIGKARLKGVCLNFWNLAGEAIRLYAIFLSSLCWG
jgi:hypothetical protein